MISIRKTEMRLTPQRMAILEYLHGNIEHPSAEDIYKNVKGRYPSMSFATVYNTIEALKKNGLVRELTIDPVKRRYDPNMELHHHMICMDCNKVRDVHIKLDINVPVEQLGGFYISDNHVEFYGTCSECREKNIKKGE
ncbi:MAG: transcriptional repressor [Nitrospirota bacterium]|nr:MAG: transcriptional repressor [Nitrospirota bacterium]